MGEKGWLLILHSFLYTLCFIPVFWFFEINYLWLIFIFLSHILIDSLGNYLLLLTHKVLEKAGATEALKKIITLGLDQVLHLTVPLIIAFLVF